MTRVVSEIRPAGGGQYTTLQGWWDASKDSTDEPWAECYSGGNLGGLALTAWAGTPSENNYVRIYAADGEKHNGQNSDVGAFINLTDMGISTLTSVNNPSLDYMRIEGLRFLNATTNTAAIGISMSNVNYVIMDSNAFWNCRMVFVYGGINTDWEWIGVVLKNSICEGVTIQSTGIVDYVEQTLNISAYNNTALFFSLSAIAGFVKGLMYPVPILHAALYNNIAITYVKVTTEYENTLTGSNNLSYDESANSVLGGVNNIVNSPLSSNLINPGVNMSNPEVYNSIGNYNKKATSPAKGAGVYVADCTTDYRGVARKNPPDMGADEQSTKWAIAPGNTIGPGTGFL